MLQCWSVGTGLSPVRCRGRWYRMRCLCARYERYRFDPQGLPGFDLLLRQVAPPLTRKLVLHDRLQGVVESSQLAVCASISGQQVYGRATRVGGQVRPLAGVCTGVPLSACPRPRVTLHRYW